MSGILAELARIQLQRSDVQIKILADSLIKSRYKSEDQQRITTQLLGQNKSDPISGTMLDFSIYFAYPGTLNTPTGGYRYDRRLIAELGDMGLDVIALSLPPCLPELDTKSLKTIEQTISEIPDQSIVVIDGLAFGVLYELAAAEAQRLKLVALCHHPLALETGLDQDQRLRLLKSERRALACARATVVTSEQTKSILVDQFAVLPERITVAVPGVDPVPLAPCDGDPIRLLTVASLTRRKAHDVLIDSLAALADLPWQARFVGSNDFDPDWAASLKARVSDLGLSERICFTGPVDDTRPEFQQADAFVLPSRFEGYGMVFAEALAAGLPIVAARAGAVPDVVQENASILVPPDDTAALTETLHRLLSDAALRRQLRDGARQASGNLPRWTDTATRFAATLQEVFEA